MKRIYLLITLVFSTYFLYAQDIVSSDNNTEGSSEVELFKIMLRDNRNSRWSIRYGIGIANNIINNVESKHQLGFSDQIQFRFEPKNWLAFDLGFASNMGKDEVYTAHLSTHITNYDNNPGTGGDWWMPIDYKSLNFEFGAAFNTIPRSNRYRQYLRIGVGETFSCKDWFEEDGSSWSPYLFLGFQPTFRINNRLSIFVDFSVKSHDAAYFGFTIDNRIYQFNYNAGAVLHL